MENNGLNFRTKVDSGLKGRVNFSSQNIKEYTFKLAETIEEYEAAYTLVYDQYISRGYMDTSPIRMRFNIYNLMPETITLIAKKSDKVIATTSIFTDSIVGLPMDKEFGKELDPFRIRGKKIAEVGALAGSTSNRDVILYLHKLIIRYLSKNTNFDYYTVTVNPKHTFFYQELYYLKTFSKIKNYTFANNNPAVAMYVNLRHIEKNLKEAYFGIENNKNFYDYIFNQDCDLFVPPSENRINYGWSKQAFTYFLTKNPHMIDQLNKKEKNYIIDYYSNWSSQFHIQFQDNFKTWNNFTLL